MDRINLLAQSNSRGPTIIPGHRGQEVEVNSRGKGGPAPWSRMTRTSGLRLSSENDRLIPSSTSPLMALRFSGRLRVTIPIFSSTSHFTAPFAMKSSLSSLSFKVESFQLRYKSSGFNTKFETRNYPFIPLSLAISSRIRRVNPWASCSPLEKTGAPIFTCTSVFRFLSR